MPTKIEQSKEGLREVDWVQKQVKEELNSLTGNVEDNFFEKNEDGKIVGYKLGIVEDYLESIKNRERGDLTAKNTSAWIMAVQIALEELWYNTGTIDGIYAEGWTTDAAVRKFQAEHGLKVDGAPGKDTIGRLLEKLKEEKEEGKDWEREEDKDWEKEEDKDWEREEGKGWEEKEEDKGWEEKEEDKDWEDWEKKDGELELFEEDITYADGFRYKWTIDEKWNKQWKWNLKSPLNKPALKTDWEYDWYFDNNEMHGKWTYKWNYGKNTFSGEREHWRIIECESFWEKINIKYDNQWWYVETKSGKKLYLAPGATENFEIWKAASVINKVVSLVRGYKWGRRLNKFKTWSALSASDDNLEIDYNGRLRDSTALGFSKTKIWISAAELADWLNEYRKDVGI